MIVEVWETRENEDCTSLSVIPQDTPVDGLKAILGPYPCKLLRTIEGADWNDCMRQHYEIMGWEPYKPMDQA